MDNENGKVNVVEMPRTIAFALEMPLAA
jgi:hypothetical protein